MKSTRLFLTPRHFINISFCDEEDDEEDIDRRGKESEGHEIQTFIQSVKMKNLRCRQCQVNKQMAKDRVWERRWRVKLLLYPSYHVMRKPSSLLQEIPRNRSLAFKL